MLLRGWTVLVMLAFAPMVNAGEKGWTEFFGKDLRVFRGKISNWEQVASVELDAKNVRKFVAQPGDGVWYNGPKGNASNLFTKEKFSDVEVHLEFNLPKGSNSGIKFHGHYEIQICDSFGKKSVTGDDCGGIYPRAELTPRYTHIDKGIAPKVNACAKPGDWQTLDAIFVAPRFGKDGKKTSNAQIVKAVLNGQIIHEKLDLLTPTGDRWKNKEMFEGPIMIQGDHGPVAFRNVKVRPYRPESK